MISIDIFQIFFSKSQLSRIEPEFTPLDNSLAGNKGLYEFEIINSIFRDGVYKTSDYVGVVSYKFRSKTKKSGCDFLTFINDNPGYDCYFINPFPHLAYLSFNVWTQAEVFHPGISKIADQVLSKLGLISDLHSVPRHNHKYLCYCNFWVANQKFWLAYGSLLDKFNQIISGLHGDYGLFTETNHLVPAPYFPFIFERLFSTFISLRTDLRCLPYPHTDNDLFASCNYPHEVLAIINLKSMIDGFDVNGKFDITKKNIMDLISSLVLGCTKKRMFTEGAPACLL